jgi:hypothetical protein
MSHVARCRHHTVATRHLQAHLGTSLTSSHDGTPRAEFLCIYHGTVTRNHRELEDEVEKDSEGKITSKIPT